MSTAGPRIHCGRSNRRLMVLVLIGLAPAAVAAAWRFGSTGSLLLFAAMGGAWIAEALCNRRQALDASAIVTGLIFGLMLPPSVPWWIALSGGVLAIVLGKQAYGGLGRNLFNPAALARAVLMGVAPWFFFAPTWLIDGVSTATPLQKGTGQAGPELMALLFGHPPGTLAQCAPLAVLAGGLFLVVIKAIDWRIPLSYLATISALALVLPPSELATGHAPWLVGNPLLHLFAGGSLLAAFFMLTDPIAAPFTASGRIVYGVVAGIATMAIRFYTPYPDGAVLAVLAANAIAPLIDRKALEPYFPA